MNSRLSTTTVTACDCHIHVYDLERYPIAQASPVSPPAASWQTYLSQRNALGISHSIIVQAMGYGFDNRCTLEALAASEGTAKAVIAMRPDAPEQELAELDAAGVVGVRFMMVPNNGNIMTWDMLNPVAARISDFGWNINLQVDGRNLLEYESLLLAQPCTIVIDHIGKFLEPVPTCHPGFQSLCRLLDTGRVWVKLSAAYETSKVGSPNYEDVGVLASALAHNYPDRCLWASNWPHPGQTLRPDDVGLVRLLDRWAPSVEVRNRILSANPTELYRF
ncbi:amidohydrolase [Pollutimonas subterranea]|uniref:Amidohydrolase n=1 Tax=Pollutimonas subterranea TaxID=2045210 RepID=A0A2N4TZN7_9BURK|nr:amidohydrolase family protein [Pollutimonas subterranea]PLC48228.1 amidohydrolase [Pollutimonas subterranea]